MRSFDRVLGWNRRLHYYAGLYFLFFVCGMATWVVFERSLLFITRSVERNRRLVTRVYFPRLILPLAATAPAVVYLAVLTVVLTGAVLYLRYQDGVWYVLEPQFQATSERLFGFTDVGSEREERDEAIALRDTTLARAVDAIEVAVAQLSVEPTEHDVAVLCATLRALRP